MTINHVWQISYASVDALPRMVETQAHESYVARGIIFATPDVMTKCLLIIQTKQIRCGFKLYLRRVHFPQVSNDFRQSQAEFVHSILNRPQPLSSLSSQ